MKLMNYDSFESKAFINANLTTLLTDASTIFDDVIFRYILSSDNPDKIAVIDVGIDNMVNYAKYNESVSINSTVTITSSRLINIVTNLGYTLHPISDIKGKYKIIYEELPFTHVVIIQGSDSRYHLVSVNNIICTQSMRFSKFLKKFTPLADETIENLSNNYKQLNYNIDINENEYEFVISKGEELRKRFSSSCMLKTGTMQHGCMNDKLDYLDIYVKNKNISLLTIEHNGLVISRRLLFKRKDGKTFANINYYSTQKADILMKKYCEREGYVTDLDSSVELEDVSMETFPYVDKYPYLNLNDNTLNSSKDNLDKYLILQDKNGEFIEVDKENPYSMMPYLLESNSIRYNDELLYNHGEQEVHNMELYVDEEKVAYVKFNVLRGKVFIDMIEAIVKGKGYGKMLMRKLANVYGYSNLERRDLTEDGEKMRAELDSEYNYTPDTPLTIDIIKNIKSKVIEEYIKYVCLFGFDEKEEKKLEENEIDIDEINLICEYIKYSVVWNNENDVPADIVKIINKYV